MPKTGCRCSFSSSSVTNFQFMSLGKYIIVLKFGHYSALTGNGYHCNRSRLAFSLGCHSSYKVCFTSQNYARLVLTNDIWRREADVLRLASGRTWNQDSRELTSWSFLKYLLINKTPVLRSFASKACLHPYSSHAV